MFVEYDLDFFRFYGLDIAIMKVFRTWSLALSFTVLFSGGVQASFSRRDDTGTTPVQLANQKRSFSVGIVCRPRTVDYFGWSLTEYVRNR